MQARNMSSRGVCVCVSVCVSVTFVNSVKRIDIASNFFRLRVATPFSFSRAKRHSNILTGTPLMGTSNAGGVGRNRDSEPIFGVTACVNAATDQVLSTRSPVDHGYRPQVVTHRW